MANSLQDQLKRSGLASDQQIRKTRADKRKQRKTNRGDDASSESKELARQAAAKKAARDRELNERLKAEAERKALAAQVRQLIEMNRVPRDGDNAFNFVDDGVVKHLHLSDEAHTGVVSGRLAIVRLGDDYAVVPGAVADKIATRDEDVVLVHNRGIDGGDDDDEYADFKVPDDLTW